VDISVPSFPLLDFPPELVVAQIAPANFAAFGEGALWALYDGELARIDLNTNQVVATIHLADGLLGVDIGVGYGSLWVLHLDSRTVWRIDPTNNAVSATITWEEESFPSTLAVGAEAVWVNSDFMKGDIIRIDPATDEIVATVNVGEWPNQMIATEDAVWITSPSDPVLRRIDPATNEVFSINLDCGTRSIAADETGLWVLCDDEPIVLRVDPVTGRIVAKIAIEHRSRSIALSGDTVWVSSQIDNTLTAIDPEFNQVHAIYRIGPDPSIVASSPDEFWLSLNGESTWRIRP
jgi:DNA-binding beta-propeller fold protein YncE